MSLKVFIAPDKFKGTLTAGAAAKAIARGWRRARPGDWLDLLPMSDGGDGFGEVLGRCLGARMRAARSVDAAHRPCQACWWWEPGTKTAVVESAEVIGLARLPAKKFHPFDLDTLGLGALLKTVSRLKPRRCIIGVGGSATNDGGYGMARALGWRFLDSAGREICQWPDLENLAHIRAPERGNLLAEFFVAVDVQNPLLGVRGATRVYGPQKGLLSPELEQAERCLRRLAHVFSNDSGSKYALLPGAGAAGGLGFGLVAFAAAQLQPGFDLFARHADLHRRLREADVVITGEGRMDRSTLMGKGVGQIARLCRRHRIPCIGLAGQIDQSVRASRLFRQTDTLVNLAGESRSRSGAGRWLELLAERTAAGSEFLNARASRARGRH